MSFWRGLITGSLLGIVAGAALLMDDDNEKQAVRRRHRVVRTNRAQRMVKGITKLAELMR
ncbi:MAG: YtxH domain-containing protein [Bacillota bacterium]